MSPAHVKIPSREESLFIAELAGEAERYEDVITQIKKIVEQFDARLTIDERNLISVAYKNLTNTLRNSWRTVDTVEKLQASRAPATTKQLRLIRRQREKIERELTTTCKDIVGLLDKQLLPATKPGEERVFYLKMKGDYYRYLAEFAQKQNRERYAEESLNAYKMAYKHALNTLEAMHPTRLGLALNFSVFFHDVKKSREHACHLAKSAFDDAVMSLDPDATDAATAQTVRDSMMILQLLQDDLVLWATEMQKEAT